MMNKYKVGSYMMYRPRFCEETYPCYLHGYYKSKHTYRIYYVMGYILRKAEVAESSLIESKEEMSKEILTILNFTH